MREVKMAIQECLADLAYAKQEIERLKRGLSMVQALSPERIWPAVLAELAVVAPTAEQEEQ